VRKVRQDHSSHQLSAISLQLPGPGLTADC
jgi:hypothetical protein